MLGLIELWLSWGFDNDWKIKWLNKWWNDQAYQTKPTQSTDQTNPSKLNLPNLTYQILPIKPNLSNNTYQMKSTKPNLPHHTYHTIPNKTKPTKQNLPNPTIQTYQTNFMKLSKPQASSWSLPARTVLTHWLLRTKVITIFQPNDHPRASGNKFFCKC